MSSDAERAFRPHPPPQYDDLRPSWLSVLAELVVLGLGIWIASRLIDQFGPKLAAPGGGAGVPSTSSVVGLIASVLLAIFCAAYAIRRRSVYLTVVIGAAAFGLFVEFFNITVFHTYAYGDSYFMLLGKVPLMIVLSWGAIIYSAMKTSDYLDLKWYLKPIYDGMLALTIDLALDPVAVCVSLWTWEVGQVNPPSVTFLGIPLANFYGWFMVVASYSLTVRAGLRYCPSRFRGAWTGAVVSSLAIPCAFALFMIAMAVYLGLVVVARVPEALVFSLVLGVLLLLILAYLATADHDDTPNPISLASPLLIHAYVMFEYYFEGLYRAAPPLGGVSPSNGLIIMLPMIAAFSLISFSWPFLDGLRDALRGVERLAEGRGDGGHGIEPT